MPGRPNTQMPDGTFGPVFVSGGECCPSSKGPPTRPLSAKQLNQRDVSRTVFDPESGAVPIINSSPRSSSLSKRMDEGKVNRLQKGPLFLPRALPPWETLYHYPFDVNHLLNSEDYGRFLHHLVLVCGHFSLEPRGYAPGIPPGKWDVPLNPREFVPGHVF